MVKPKNIKTTSVNQYKYNLIYYAQNVILKLHILEKNDIIWEVQR